MPELPEVETTVLDLKTEVLGRTFVGVWTDSENLIKSPKNFAEFRKGIKGKKIKNIWRRGKNIIFDLSNKFLLIHQKLTGHLLLGKWQIVKAKSQKYISSSLSPRSRDRFLSSKVKSLIKGALEEPINQFIHLIFYLDDGRQLALSDLRKFAKVKFLNREELKKELASLGPEPLEKDFTFEKFKGVLPKRGKIKQVLIDQRVIAGIGNIYSDEILWQAKVHPFKDVSNLRETELKKIYQAIKEILPKAIAAGGESISDFRRISGEKGGFDPLRQVYRREGEKCRRCNKIIKKAKLVGRSVHFCSNCQKF